MHHYGRPHEDFLEVDQDIARLDLPELLRRSLGRMRPGGKSGLHRAGCRVTPGEGDLEESATENRPPDVPSALSGQGEKVE